MSRITTAKLAGKKAARRGGAIERALEHIHAAHRHAGTACIDKLHKPTVFAGKGLYRVIGRAPVDFSGAITHHGAVFMELKSCQDEAASLTIGERGVQQEQLRELQDRCRFTPHVYIAWYNGDTLGLLDVHALSRDYSYSQKRIPRVMFDWLPAHDLDWVARVIQRAGVKP
jgi:hypothetical protein